MKASQAVVLRKVIILNILVSFLLVTLDSYAFGVPMPIVPADPLLKTDLMLN